MRQHHVAYVSLWFPKPSETFIFREVVRMRAMGLPITVFSLYGPIRKALSPEMAAFSPQVERLGALGAGKILQGMAWQAARNTRRFAREWVALPLASWGGLERTGENLWAFLAGSHIARRANELGVTHIHSPWACGPATAAMTASRLTGIPFSFAARAGDIHPPERALRRKAAAASFIRVNTRHNLDFLRDQAVVGAGDLRAASKVHLVYNALTLEQPLEAALPMQAPFRLLAMGRFVRTKGFEHLIEAVDILRSQGLDCVLDLVGSGPWRGRYDKLVAARGLEDRVRFPGFVSHDKVPELMAGADVFVTPSVIDPTGDRDGIPNVIMEAMANRLPVVASDVAGIAEVVQDGVTGRLVPQRDPAALALAVASLCRDRALALRLAEAGRALVRNLFDHERNCSTLIELFRAHSRR